MAGEAGDCAVVPDDALAAIHHADGLVLGFKQWTLFDVQFDERGKFLLPDGVRAAIADGVERLGDGDAVGVLASENIVRGIFARIGGRGHHRGRVARAFLVGPVADANGHLGLDAGVVHGADDFECGEGAENAVVLAAGGLGVEMRADADGRLDMSRPGRIANMVPSASTWTSQPAASQALRNQSRTCLSSGPRVSRRTPPFGVPPNFAVS